MSPKNEFQELKKRNLCFNVNVWKKVCPSCFTCVGNIHRIQKWVPKRRIKKMSFIFRCSTQLIKCILYTIWPHLSTIGVAQANKKLCLGKRFSITSGVGKTFFQRFWKFLFLALRVAKKCIFLNMTARNRDFTLC